MFSCLLGHLCSMVISKQASWINETISLTSIHLTSLLSILSNAVNKNFFFFFLMKLHALDLIRWFKTIAYKKKKKCLPQTFLTMATWKKKQRKTVKTVKIQSEIFLNYFPQEWFFLFSLKRGKEGIEGKRGRKEEASLQSFTL